MPTEAFNNWIKRWHACVAKEPILKSTINICIAIRENLVFFLSKCQILLLNDMGIFLFLDYFL